MENRCCILVELTQTLPPLQKNSVVFCEQEEKLGVCKLAGKLTDVFYTVQTAVFKQNQEEAAVEVPCSSSVMSST